MIHLLTICKPNARAENFKISLSRNVAINSLIELDAARFVCFEVIIDNKGGISNIVNVERLNRETKVFFMRLITAKIDK